MRLVFLFFVVASVCGCTSKEEYRVGLIGAWQSIDHEKSRTECFDLYADGSYRLVDLTQANGPSVPAKRVSNTGQWHVKDGGRLNMTFMSNEKLSQFRPEGEREWRDQGLPGVSKPGGKVNVRLFVKNLSADGFVYRRKVMGGFASPVSVTRVDNCDHLMN